MNTDVSILVLSCDAYEDIIGPFFILKERYWSDCPYKTYISTETKEFSQATTLTHNYTLNRWTRRIKESLMDIDSKYVILMDSDFYIRQPVDQKRIDYCIESFDCDTATFSFELEYAPTYPSKKDGFRLKPNKSPYLCSCQPSIWDREKLISLLQKDMNPWQWERQIIDTPFKHYVNSGNVIIDIGYYLPNGKKHWYGVRKGKWVEDDVVELFKKENIGIDFSKRGFYK